MHKLYYKGLETTKRKKFKWSNFTKCPRDYKEKKNYK